MHCTWYPGLSDSSINIGNSNTIFASDLKVPKSTDTGWQSWKCENSGRIRGQSEAHGQRSTGGHLVGLGNRGLASDTELQNTAGTIRLGLLLLSE